MAFEDDLARHIDKIKDRLPHIRGEESTKHSLVGPLLQVLGYDIFDPREVQPEYGADFKRSKPGQAEKVDYAIKIRGEAAIFIECKAADVELENHDSQLARYFNTTPSVRVAIITNGVRIKVFTDLQMQNMMDDKPWMDFDLRSIKPAEIDALKRFRKTDFAADQIIGLAEEMVYYNVLVPFISSQLRDPGEKLVRLVAEEISSIKRVDKKIVDRLTPILRKAITASIQDLVARSINSKAEMVAEEPPPSPTEINTVVVTADNQRDGAVTTPEEQEIYNLIVKMIHEKFPTAAVAPRDSRSYFTIHQKNVRKWFIRLGVEKQPYWIAFRHLKPESARTLCPGFEITDGNQFGDSKVSIKGVPDVAKLKPLILAAYEAEAARIADPSDQFADGETGRPTVDAPPAKTKSR